ncbi:cytochrome p450 monooxygenase [Colletotrichum incanum]|nr:cytochrome p450 monooxygenase [Colletotrichum incanum]
MYRPSLPHLCPACFINTAIERRKANYNSATRKIADAPNARRRFPGQPFRVMTDLGEAVILPPDFAAEIQKHPHFSFTKAYEQRQCERPVRYAEVPEVADMLCPMQVWEVIDMKQCVLELVARVSSRIFLGEELCHDEQWLSIAKTYTTNFFVAATKLRLFPRATRRLVHWWIPECYKLRHQLHGARLLLHPIIEGRRQLRQAATDEGQDVPVYDDALEWIEEEAISRGVSCDPALVQLLLTTVAITTTTDLVQQCMICFAQHPEIFKPLREEISCVLAVGGWTKSSLYEMKLLDSAIKESQRLKPSSIVSMRRYVEERVKLSTGIVLEKGTRTYVDSYRMWDADTYENPEDWNAWRFFNLRGDPEKERLSQLVSTGPNNLAWGHGEHGCPGRFFAADEVKIMMCHLLVEYDWTLEPSSNLKPVIFGISAKTHPSVRLVVRRRGQNEKEIDLSNV